MTSCAYAFIAWLLMLCLTPQVSAETLTVQQEKMQALSFMAGKWVGMSRTFSEGKASAVPAFQQIEYKVDNSILTIDLLSDSLLIHTVIYYDSKDATYYYHPYYKGGAGKYKGEVIDGKFWVYFNENRRIVFERLADGRFREYGENLVDGHWQKYFEDTFTQPSATSD